MGLKKKAGVRRGKRSAKRRRRPKIGDIVAIPLPNGRFAFGRIYADASIGVLRHSSDTSSTDIGLLDLTPVFVVGVFSYAIRSGDWPIVGHVDFPTEDAAWPPPHVVNNIVNPNRPSIYSRGIMRVVSPSEAAGLEVAAMYKPDQLVARIVRAGIAAP